jgi:hypothetical protein
MVPPADIVCGDPYAAVEGDFVTIVFHARDLLNYVEAFG